MGVQVYSVNYANEPTIDEHMKNWQHLDNEYRNKLEKANRARKAETRERYAAEAAEAKRVAGDYFMRFCF